MTDALTRARADLESGRAWKARDRLSGLLTDRQDDEVLDLLAQVHREMGNLPDAGALWFVTGRDDGAAREALAAWRERFGSDIARINSIPGPVRRGREHDLRRLQDREARRPRAERDLPPADGSDWKFGVSVAGCLLFGLWVVALAVVGAVVVFRAVF